MCNLSQIKDNTVARITEINGDSYFQSRITAIGLTIGSEVKIIQNNTKQPILFYNRDTLIALNRKEAEKVCAEVI